LYYNLVVRSVSYGKCRKLKERKQYLPFPPKENAATFACMCGELRCWEEICLSERNGGIEKAF
jgi:hypothetical protein